MSDIEQRLQALGIVLPQVTPPAANYVPFVAHGGVLIVSGQLPMQDGKPQFIGKVGRELSLEQGQSCARLCAINVLACLKTAIDGDWSRLIKTIRLGIFVNAPDDYTDHPKVANGASDFLVDVLGDKGKHARAAVGMSGLPFGVGVEVEGMFAIKE